MKSTERVVVTAENSRWSSSYLSITGSKRRENRDVGILDAGLDLFILCDGSTDGDGATAAGMASNYLRAAVRSAQKQIQAFADVPGQATLAPIKAILSEAIQKACKEIFVSSKKNGINAGSSTSLDVLLLLSNYALLGHVGQSRVAYIKDSSFHVVTEDHTRYGELIKMLPREKVSSALKKIIQRDLGSAPSVSIDFREIPLFSCDGFIMYTDGFNEVFDSTPVRSFQISQNSPLEAVEYFGNIANTIAIPDDASLIVIKSLAKPSTASIVSDSRKEEGKLSIIRMLPMCLEFQDDINVLRTVASLFVECNFGANQEIVKEGDESTE